MAVHDVWRVADARVHPISFDAGCWRRFRSRHRVSFRFTPSPLICSARSSYDSRRPFLWSQTSCGVVCSQSTTVPRIPLRPVRTSDSYSHVEYALCWMLTRSFRFGFYLNHPPTAAFCSREPPKSCPCKPLRCSVACIELLSPFFFELVSIATTEKSCSCSRAPRVRPAGAGYCIHRRHAVSLSVCPVNQGFTYTP